ncbi:hypothetical protein BN1708_012783, partial [Verticillium longisporum]
MFVYVFLTEFSINHAYPTIGIAGRRLSFARDCCALGKSIPGLYRIEQQGVEKSTKTTPAFARVVKNMQ